MIKWLDLIDQTQLNQLANSYNLHLNTTTTSFLESFATLVHQASNTRRRLLEVAKARKTHLHTVNSLIAHELFHLQNRIPHAHIIPYRHPETSLPIVYVRIHRLPDLVVHVFRSYAINNYALTFGFRAYSFCRRPLTGPIASAANYLRARCTAKSWNISVSELISVWCHHVRTMSEHNSPTLPPANNSPNITRRRRRPNPSPSPPVAEHNNFQSSLPHDHPNTDVIIKDDRLFPNRTFDDPEELYAEQVRLIRKKRKPSSVIIDDAELAWKKRRKSTSPQPASPSQPASSSQHAALSQPRSSPQPAPSSPPAPQPQPALNPPPTNPPRPSPQSHPASAELPDDAFINPLSPEPHEERLPEQPQLPQEDKVNSPTVGDAAPSRNPHPLPPSPQPSAETRQVESPPPADAVPVAEHDEDDDGSTPVFSFSTALPPPAPEVAHQVPTPEQHMEDVKVDTAEKPVPETYPVNVEPLKDAVPAHPASDLEKSGSRETPIAKPFLSLPVSEIDQGLQEENEFGTPTTLHNDANSISPQGSTPLVSGLDKELPEDIEYALSNDRLDRMQAHPHEAKASPQAEEEQVEKDSATVSVGKSKKRRRGRDCDADVIVVDIDSDEEPDETNKGKKRRLSAPQDVPDSPAAPSDQRSTQGGDISGGVKEADVVSDKHEKLLQPDAEKEMGENKEKLPTLVQTTSDGPFPQKEASRSIEKSEANDRVDTVQEATRTPKVRQSSAKEVTRDVESPFTGYGGASIPAGVDRDPCPMALSEPSESSEGSSDEDSNSDTGSVSDGALER